MRALPDLDQVISEYLSVSEKEISRIMPEESSTELPKMCRYIIEAGGKRLRPMLTLLACEAVKGDMKKAVPVSAAIELAHTLGIIQDDIFDQATMRRGVKAVHAVWGIHKAILASDYLFLKMVESVLETGNSDMASKELAPKILHIVVNAGLEAVEGEYLDLQLSERKEATVEECISVADKKTGAFIKAALEVGALVGGGIAEEIRLLRDYGGNLGIAFQVMDDVIGLTGTLKLVGKDIGADITNRRMTAVMAYALQNSSPALRKKTLEILKAPEPVKKNLSSRIQDILEETHAIDFARKLAEEYSERALAELRSLKPSRAKEILEIVPAIVVKRGW